MKIRILNGARGRDLNAAVLAEVIETGFDITWDYPFCFFEVKEWSQFLGVVWRAFSIYSRKHSLSAKNSIIHVKVIMDDGREFGTEVWFDEVYKGLRYVSLY